MNIDGLNNIKVIDIGNVSRKALSKAIKTKPNSFGNIYQKTRKLIGSVANQKEDSVIVNVASNIISQIAQKCNLTFKNIKSGSIKQEAHPKRIALSSAMFNNNINNAKTIYADNSISTIELENTKTPEPNEPKIIDLQPIASANESIPDMKQPEPNMVPEAEINIAPVQMPTAVVEPTANISPEIHEEYDPTDPKAVSENYNQKSEAYIKLRQQEKQTTDKINALKNQKDVCEIEANRILASADKCEEKIKEITAKLNEWQQRKTELTEEAQKKFEEENEIDKRVADLNNDLKEITVNKPQAYEALEQAKMSVASLNRRLREEYEKAQRGLHVLQGNFSSDDTNEQNNSDNEIYIYGEREHRKAA